MSAAPRGWGPALDALEQPLAFVCRGGVPTLRRVRDLEATLRALAHNAQLVAPSPAQRRELDSLIGALPPSLASPEVRLARLQRCWGIVRELRSPKSTSPAAEPPDVSQATGPKTSGGAAVKSALKASNRDVEDTAQELSPAAPVQFVKGVGPRIAEFLAQRALRTVDELLRFWPRRYEARGQHQTIGELRPGEKVSVEALVASRTTRMLGRRRVLEVILRDASGVLRLVWFRVPGRGYADRFETGRWVRVSGKVTRYRQHLQMAHPETQFLDGDGRDVSSAGDEVVPIYLDVPHVRPAQLRRIIDQALPAAGAMVDVIPPNLAIKRGWAPFAEAVTALHRPPAEAALSELLERSTPWHRRLSYEELLMLQLAVLRRKADAARESGIPVPLTQPLVETAEAMFPFTLTAAQARVLGELEGDLRQPVPMHRLVQGDVGSGKTAVALTTAAAVARAGLQAAVMAPTELLAEQHARAALRSLPRLGIRVGLLTGQLSSSDRRSTLAQLATGHINVVIGTHALIQEKVRFQALALGIVDEQHRFGVKQRARLVELGREGLGTPPHILAMTATPIPRTLALTVYGDLDLSVIDALPPGRTPIRTRLVRDSDRSKVYDSVRQQIDRGGQAYVVYPLVEESDREGMARLRDATSAAEELANGPLSGVRVGLLHGRMPSDEKDRVMRGFAAGDIKVLVATTVIEVGIDVPNATLMVIEHAERFGLSQLHQLRGRVGRGERASECILVAQYTRSEEAWRRLRVMERTHDGFVIAEEDLAIRGPGDFLGTRQSGLPLLAMANLARDQDLLAMAREDAEVVLAADPSLELPEHKGLLMAFTRFREQWEWAQVG